MINTGNSKEPENKIKQNLPGSHKWVCYDHIMQETNSTFPGIDSEHKDAALTIQSDSKLTTNKVCESKDKDIGLTCWQLPCTEK